jgi:hypothetical protein
MGAEGTFICQNPELGFAHIVSIAVGLKRQVKMTHGRVDFFRIYFIARYNQ